MEQQEIRYQTAIKVSRTPSPYSSTSASTASAYMNKRPYWLEIKNFRQNKYKSLARITRESSKLLITRKGSLSNRQSSQNVCSQEIQREQVQIELKQQKLLNLQDKVDKLKHEKEKLAQIRKEMHFQLNQLQIQSKKVIQTSQQLQNLSIRYKIQKNQFLSEIQAIKQQNQKLTDKFNSMKFEFVQRKQSLLKKLEQLAILNTKQKTERYLCSQQQQVLLNRQNNFGALQKRMEIMKQKLRMKKEELLQYRQSIFKKEKSNLIRKQAFDQVYNKFFTRKTNINHFSRLLEVKLQAMNIDSKVIKKNIKKKCRYTNRSQQRV